VLLRPNYSFFGILVVLASYAFLVLYLGWMFAGFLPEWIAEWFPAEVYRLVLPLMAGGSLGLYLLFTYVSWRIEVKKVEEMASIGKGANEERRGNE
jgi:hypothetical protein